MFRERNSNTIDLELVWFRFSGVEVWWALLVAMALGVGLSAIVLGFAWLRSRLLNSRYRRVIKRLESELHEMRSLPLAGDPHDLPKTNQLDPAQVSAPARQA